MDKQRLTDNEVIKALERMSEEDPEGFSADILDLINRLKAKNKEFDEKIVIQMGTNDWQVKEINHLKAEIDRLRYILVNFMGEIFDWGNKNGVDTRIFAQTAILGKEKDGAVKQIKSEAYKEFAEKLKRHCSDIDTDNINEPSVCILYDAEETIDGVLKDMMEGNK